MASKRRNMFHKNKTQETTEIVVTSMPPPTMATSRNMWIAIGRKGDCRPRDLLTEKRRCYREPQHVRKCHQWVSPSSTHVLPCDLRGRRGRGGVGWGGGGVSAGPPTGLSGRRRARPGGGRRPHAPRPDKEDGVPLIREQWGDEREGACRVAGVAQSGRGDDCVTVTDTPPLEKTPCLRHGDSASGAEVPTMGGAGGPRSVDLPPPPDGGWGWVVVFGSFMIHVFGESHRIIYAIYA
ncbi:hypothetical protein AAG570_001933 [Ranatra chinensis]|uniref:Uncharacterized protein n=1 Tax=Ranatra chinensis TaxID=642074 RepID=A0ABD0YWG5_9HEMI